MGVLGYRYVALRSITVGGRTTGGGLVEHHLKPGDVVPADVDWRNPDAWVTSGHIAPYLPAGGPGRPVSHVTLDERAPLATPAADRQATAAVIPDADAEAKPAGDAKDWEDLTGDAKPDGYGAYQGEDTGNPTVTENAAPARKNARKK